ncbi:MAG: MaoC family dehydratase [Candidatus Izemoplasma sp.]
MTYNIDEIKIGYKLRKETLIEEKNVELFGKLVADLNPAHFDNEYASKTIFKKRIAHGMFIGSLFSSIFGMDYPGRGSIYLSQSLKFTAPVYFNDLITSEIIVKEIIKEKNKVIFTCTATNQDGRTVIIGEAVIMPPRK